MCVGGALWEGRLDILHLISDAEGSPSSSLTPIPSCCSSSVFPPVWPSLPLVE